MLLAAGLIARFGRLSDKETYEKASRCFDILLDARESPEAARRISRLIDREMSSVQHSAGTVIDHLLFNQANDPYVCLGLPRYAGRSEVTRRWKRLIVSYHPDKYPNQREYEERAKKINEAYGEICKNSAAHTFREAASRVVSANAQATRAVHHRKYLKHVPIFILALVIFLAVACVVLFISSVKYAGNY